MRVLIIGEGKSGTTALLRSVAEAMGDPEELFEPRLMTAEDLDRDPLVVKKLLLNWRGAKEGPLTKMFDKRVYIVRDPRDRLISHMLYDAYNRGELLSTEQREKWLALLGRKAKTPKRVPIFKMMNAWWRISRGDLMSNYVRALDRSSAFNKRFGGRFHTITYEQYVDGDFAALNDYLGLELSAGVVKGSENRVARSGSYDEWRRWFTPSDVAMFRPMTHRWMIRHGYDHRDWKLSEPGQTLDHATTVGYVEELFSRCPLPKESD